MPEEKQEEKIKWLPLESNPEVFHILIKYSFNLELIIGI